MPTAKSRSSEGESAVSLRGSGGYVVSSPRPLERPVDREQLRRRALAFAGLWFLLAGMLAALGISIVLIASVALALVGGAVVGGLWLVRRYEPARAVRAAGPPIERASRKVRPSIERTSRKVRPTIERTSGKLRPSIERTSRKVRSSLDELDAGQRLGRLATGAAQQARHALELRPQKQSRPQSTRASERVDSTSSEPSFGVTASTNRLPSNTAPRWRSCATSVTGAQKRSR